MRSEFCFRCVIVFFLCYCFVFFSDFNWFPWHDIPIASRNCHFRFVWMWWNVFTIASNSYKHDIAPIILLHKIIALSTSTVNLHCPVASMHCMLCGVYVCQSVCACVVLLTQPAWSHNQSNKSMCMISSHWKVLAADECWSMYRENDKSRVWMRESN